jgi:hypothetical protein
LQPLALQLMMKMGWGAGGGLAGLAGSARCGRLGLRSPSWSSSASLSLVWAVAAGGVLALAGWRSLRAAWGAAAAVPAAAHAGAKPSSSVANVIEPRILLFLCPRAVAALATNSPFERRLSYFLYFV